MVCCTLDTIVPTTKIQVVTFIFIFLCCLFCVNEMIFISMIIVNELYYLCIFAMTGCGTDQKKPLAIITDNSSAYYNKNGEVRCGGNC